MRFEALVLIFFELALGRLYAIKERRLDMNNVRKLEPVIQYLEVPEVPPEYEDDDKPSKYLNHMNHKKLYNLERNAIAEDQKTWNSSFSYCYSTPIPKTKFFSDFISVYIP